MIRKPERLVEVKIDEGDEVARREVVVGWKVDLNLYRTSLGDSNVCSRQDWDGWLLENLMTQGHWAEHIVSSF